jgi:peptidoglycan/LPS O-acetylase OafA/YrhL
MKPETPTVIAAIQRTPLGFFCDGTAAVLLFFTLSGFVLNFGYTDGRPLQPGWAGSFLIRRIFRIYPAFFAAMAIAIVFRTTFFKPEWVHVFSTWFSAFWQEPVKWPRIANSLLLVGSNKHSTFLIPPMWSLTFEMRVSLFFPLIILLLRPRRSITLDVALLVAVYAISFAIFPFSSTFDFVPFFILGAICAKYFQPIRTRLSSLSLPAKVAWVVVSLFVYGSRPLFELNSIAPATRDFLINQVVGLGGAGLILAAGSMGRVDTFLRARVCQFAGRISYSFYLIHFPILIAIAPLIYFATHSMIATAVASFLISCVSAELLYRFVEMPGMRAGARISETFMKRREGSL